jgi:hypothetical protein
MICCILNESYDSYYSIFPIIKNIETSMYKIKNVLNTSFIEQLEQLDQTIIESQKYLQIKLQNNLISLAEQQRHIVRMDRQLNAVIKIKNIANKLHLNDYLFTVLKIKRNINFNYVFNDYSFLFLQILICFFIGMIYERYFKKKF